MNTIERLEDLRHVLADMLINLNGPKVLFRPHRVELENAGLIQHVGSGLYERTERGAALVADYQWRQQMASELSAETELAEAKRRIAALEAALKPFAQDYENYTAETEDNEDADTFIEWANHWWDNEAVLSSFERAYYVWKGLSS